MTRRDSLVALLRSLEDLRYAPETATGNLQRRAQVKRALAPSRKEPCDVCADNPVKGRLRNLRPCERCGGNPSTGKPGRGWRYVDPYDRSRREVGGEGGGSKTALRDVYCDGCGGPPPQGWGGTLPNGKPCPNAAREFPCRGGIRRKPVTRVDTVNVGTSSDAEDGVIQALERRESAGHYRELDQALEALKAEHPSWHVMVMRTFVFPYAVPLFGEQAQALENGLCWLEARLPDPLLVPEWALKQRKGLVRPSSIRGAAFDRARETRDREIRERRAKGEPVSSLMEAFGMARQTVYDVLRKEAA